MERQLLAQVLIDECEIDHGCCHECDGCEGGEWAQPEGPLEPPQYGPLTHYQQRMHDMEGLMVKYYAKVNTLIPRSIIPRSMPLWSRIQKIV